MFTSELHLMALKNTLITLSYLTDCYTLTTVWCYCFVQWQHLKNTKIPLTDNPTDKASLTGEIIPVQMSWQASSPTDPPPSESLLGTVSGSFSGLSIQLLRSGPFDVTTGYAEHYNYSRLRESVPDLTQSYVSGITAVNDVLVWRGTCASADQISPADG